MVTIFFFASITSGFCEDILKPIQLKPNEVNLTNETITCYGDEGTKRIDDALDQGIKCSIELKNLKLKDNKNSISSIPDCSNIEAKAIDERPFFKRDLFQVLTTLFIGGVIGVGVVNAF